MQALYCPTCQHGFLEHKKGYCEHLDCSCMNRLDMNGLWAEGIPATIPVEKVIHHNDNHYWKLVAEKEITKVEDLTKYAEIRINSVRIRASTAVMTITALLAVLISAYYPAIQAAEKASNLPLGWSVAALLVISAVLIFDFMKKQSGSLQDSEAWSEFKKYLQAKKFLEEKGDS